MSHSTIRASLVGLAAAIASSSSTPAQAPAGCRPPSGETPWMDTSQTAECVLVGYRWYNAKGQQLFPFGHGLSYTTFRYGDLQAKSAGDSATVSVRLTNTGSRAGAEVAQLYLEYPAAPRSRRAS